MTIDDLYTRLTAQGVRVKYQDKAHRSLLIGECDVAVGSKSGAITYTCRTGAHSAEQIQAQPISQPALGGGGNSEAGGSSQANAPADGWSTGARFTTSRHEFETGVRGQNSNNGVGGQAGLGKFAIAYARYGIRVFPCHEIERDRLCSCGKSNCESAGKHPRIKDWQILATADEDQIRAWWRQWPAANIGVACGDSSNLTVLDVDGEAGRAALRALELEHGELPETPIALTGSGGCHYYFAYQREPNNAVRFAPGLDIRTQGGLVVGVGSRNSKGPYRWEAAFTLAQDFQPARMPQWLVDVIGAGQKSQASNGGRVMLPARPLAEGEGRNNTLYRLGRSLKAQGLPQNAIQFSLEASNNTFAQPLAAKELSLVVQQVLTQVDRPDFGVQPIAGAVEALEEQILRPLTVGQLYDLVDEWDRQPWVWDGILPHASLSLLVGKSESGKSTLLYALIYSILKGLSFFGRQCEQGRVLYLAGDPMSEIVAGKTFRALEVDRNDGLLVLPGALVSNPTALPQLRQIAKDFRPSLIVGDTMAATINLDTDKYGQSYQVQQPIVKLARDFSPNFVMSHHSQKAAVESYSVVDSALGSVGVAAVASTRMVARVYRRGQERFHTFEMSNLRIGQPIEGEWVVHKLESGLVELGDLWKSKASAIERESILKALEDETEPVSGYELYRELQPKPKYGLFKAMLRTLVKEKEVKAEKGKGKGSGGGWRYSRRYPESDGGAPRREGMFNE